MSVPGQMFLLLGALAVLTPACLCQAKPATHTVSGQVVNSVTGQPIARALVQIGPQYGMLTDHEGRFSFSDVPEGYGGVFASKPGYFLPESGASPGTQPLMLKMNPEAIISGTITDPLGNPIQDLRVQLKMLQIRNGLRRWQQAQSTTTSVEGEYRFAELVSGKYRVVTSLQVEGLPEAASSVTFLPATYPPPESDTGNSAITLAAGDHVEANLIPAAEKSWLVTGVIHGPLNRGVSIQAQTPDGEPFDARARVYPGTGAFRLMMPSGSYQLKVQSFVQPQPLFGIREISVGHSPLEGVSVSLEPAITIPVEVDYQAVGTKPEQQPSPQPPAMNFTLENADPDGPERSYPVAQRMVPARARVAESAGPLVIANVEPGRYVLQAQPNPPWYLASATCDNLDLLREPLVVSAGTGVCTIHAVVRNDSSTLRWSMATSDVIKLNGSVFVSILPLGNLTASDRSDVASSTPEGSSLQGTASGLAPGRYLVVGLPQQKEIPYRDPDAMKTYMPLGQEVTLPVNGEAEIQLQPVLGEP
jgi:Carboxypeptidase regulatory-like domain